VELAVGDVDGVPELGGVAGDGEEVIEVNEIGGDADAGFVEAEAAIDFEVVVVDFGLLGRGGVGPEAGGVFDHGDGFGHTFKANSDLGGEGILIAKGDGAVGMNGEVLGRGCLGGEVGGGVEEGGGGEQGKTFEHGRNSSGTG